MHYSSANKIAKNKAKCGGVRPPGRLHGGRVCFIKFSSTITNTFLIANTLTNSNGFNRVSIAKRAKNIENSRFEK